MDLRTSTANTMIIAGARKEIALSTNRKFEFLGCRRYSERHRESILVSPGLTTHGAWPSAGV